MKFTPLKIKGAFLIELDCHRDERGTFTKFFCKEEFLKAGIKFNSVQCNVSVNYKAGTLRGLHFQMTKKENKLVSCICGACYDVCVDIDKNSPTYLQWEAVELSQDNGKMILIPPACAHGFQTLKNNTVICYHVNEIFKPNLYSGLCWNDPKIGIIWPKCKKRIINDRDKNYELL
ncbi:MAG: dTDP-4-dehydrorhamnose 3,5-epimerase [Endomicrobium sp.]|jgi:dTDP-4-dehydrorhamnose 3,5-epimerase|nr:dTDP-4-dehydrorhamnose 3,5-epimerase [Endomicrobium sp.]